jgi:YggT family protein
VGLIVRLLDLYSLVVLVSVVLSWVPLRPRNPVVTLVSSLVEPVLAPIRRVLPVIGGFDLSPMVLLFALQGLKGFFHASDG